MSTHIFDVELRIKSTSGVYKHFLDEAHGDELLACFKIQQALNKAIYGLLKREVFPTAKGGEGE